MTQIAAERTLIGLTGNIATGKSTVAAMLADLGATVVDADKTAHEVMRRGSEVYVQIVAAFGKEIVAGDGEIDRKQLGNIVFDNPAQLRRLEGIVHPATATVVRERIARAETPVVVVEAIKLIEAGWHQICHALWVTTCPQEQQIARLMAERSQSREEAQQRVNAQPPQSDKIELADVVIDTSGEIDQTRRQVEAAWEAVVKGGSMDSSASYQVSRARPSDAEAITEFVAQATRGRVAVDPLSVLERFGTKGLVLARNANGEIVGLAGWRAENLVAQIDDFLVFPPGLYESAGRSLVDSIENAAQELQCEVCMILVPPRASPRLISFYQSCGYERAESEQLPRVWQQTVQEAEEVGRFIMLRQLREDLVRRPI